MIILISLLSILVILFFFCVTVSIVFNYKFEQAIPVVCFAIVFIIYIVGIVLNNLAYGVYLVLFLFLASVIFTIYSALTKKVKWHNIFTVGFVLFFFSVGVFSLVHRKSIVASWDEFSHWALVVKNMFTFDKFGNYAGATTSFKSYPPSVSLVLYFMQKISKRYTPQLLFIGMNILFFSLISPVFKKLKFTEWKKALVSLSIVILTPNIFYNDFFSSLYVDALLGVVFAYILFIYYSEKLSWQKTVNISLAMFFLVNIKSAGTGLAIMLLVVMLFDILIIKNPNNTAKSKAIFLLIVSTFFMFAKKSWEWYLISSDNNPEAWSTSAINKTNLEEFASGSAPNYRYDVCLSFLEGIFKTPVIENIVKLSYFICIIFVLVIIYFFYKNTKDANSMKVLLVLLGVFSCVYAVSMLILYLFTFSEYEALRLASFQRYMSIFVLGIVAFLIFQVLTDNRDKDCSEAGKSGKLPKLNIHKQKYLISLVVILCISNIYPLFKTIAINPHFYSEEKKSISEIRLRQEKIAVSLEKNSKVYIIAQNTNGFEFWQSRYNFTPIHINSNSIWSLGEPYNNGDVWTKDISPEQWAEVLYDEYNYVYIEKVDDIFIERYGSLFDQLPKSSQLYTVIKSTDKNVILSPIFS